MEVKIMYIYVEHNVVGEEYKFDAYAIKQVSLVKRFTVENYERNVGLVCYRGKKCSCKGDQVAVQFALEDTELNGYIFVICKDIDEAKKVMRDALDEHIVLSTSIAYLNPYHDEKFLELVDVEI
jgi:hypothetical protein